MFNFLTVLFPRGKTEAMHQRQLEDLRKGLVAMYARGNARLQQGKYITKEEAARRKKVVSTYRF